MEALKTRKEVEKRNKFVGFRVTEKELKILQNLAKEDGEPSLSDFMRTITNEKLKDRVIE